MKDKSVLWPRIFAVVALALAVMAYLQSRSPAGAFRACAFLLLAWRLAFVGAPSLGMSTSDLYRLKREGRFVGTLTGKLCDVGVGLLFLASVAAPEAGDGT